MVGETLAKLRLGAPTALGGRGQLPGLAYRIEDDGLTVHNTEGLRQAWYTDLVALSGDVAEELIPIDLDVRTRP